MDKKNAIRRAKRQSKVLEDNFWDCSVCTYRNTAEAFKCLMCDVRKGTSTRKPRLNQALVAQQAGAAGGAAGGAGGGAGAGAPGGAAERAPPAAGKRRAGGARGGRRRRWPPRLRDVDRSSGQAREVTVNSVTVVITEYKRRPPAPHTSDNEDSSDTRP